MKRIIFTLFILTWIGFSAKAQVKIGNNPTVIESNNNLEVESATTSGNPAKNNKFSVDKNGKVTIKDGTEGAGKLLVSDANGTVSFQSPRSGILVKGVLPVKQSADLVVASGGRSSAGQNGAVVFYDLGATITLPPGRWMVISNIYMAAVGNEGKGANLFVYLSTTADKFTPPISYSHSTGAGILKGIAISQGTDYNSSTPQIIENNSNVNQTYYVLAFANKGTETAGGYPFGNGYFSISPNVNATSCLFAYSLDIGN